MKMKSLKMKSFFVALLGVAFAASSALAHPGHTHVAGNGFVDGFAHPWGGLDHLLAMIAVGLLGVQLGGAALWTLPSCFVGAMIAGGLVGASATTELPAIEIGIALSVIALGAALAVDKKTPLVVLALVIAAFGFVHGHAHGAEMPTLAKPMLYAAGFVLATALLHAAGITLGLVAQRFAKHSPALRLTGAAISIAGVVILINGVL